MDDLAEPGGRLHPVQRALVDAHALAVRILHPGVRDEPVHPLPHGGPGGPRHRERLARRQPVPLHRLSPDRGRGPRVLFGGSRRCVREARGRDPRGGSPPLRRAKTISSPGTRTRSSPPPPPRTGSRRSRARFPDATIVAGATDVGPLDHQAASRAFPASCTPAESPPCTRYARRTTGWRWRRGDLRGGRAGAPRPRPGHRRDAAPSRGRSRCARPAPSAATSPTAPRSGTPARSHRPRRRHRAPPPRHEADPPARGLLPRLRPPGPGAGRDPDPHRRAAARPGGALPVLQGLEALRSGHLRPPRRLRLRIERGPRGRGVHRLRGHGRDAEARPERRARRHRSSPRRAPRPGRPPPTPSPTTSLRSTTTGRAPPTE